MIVSGTPINVVGKKEGENNQINKKEEETIIPKEESLEDFCKRVHITKATYSEYISENRLRESA